MSSLHSKTSSIMVISENDDSELICDLYKESLQYIREQNYEGAFENLSEILQLDPRKVCARNHRANVNYSLERFSESASEYRKAILLKPNSYILTTNLGNAYFSIGNFLKYGSSISAASNKTNNNDGKSNDRKSTATAAATTATTISATAATGAASEEKNPDATKKTTTTTSSSSSSSSSSSNGHSQKKKEEEEKAQIFYKDSCLSFARAICLNRSDPLAWEYLGSLQFEMRNLLQSVRSLVESRRLGPTRASVHANLGDTYRDLGESELAYESYSRAISLDEEKCETPFNNRAAILNSWNRFQEALKDSSRAIELNPSSPFPRRHKANALLGLGKCRQAVEEVLAAIELLPDYFEAYVTLGNCYRKMTTKAFRECENQMWEAYRTAARICPEKALEMLDDLAIRRNLLRELACQQ